MDRNSNLKIKRRSRRRVAPLAGSVDRNCQTYDAYRIFKVAPLAGSVDRNGHVGGRILARDLFVAPLAGSVGRNDNEEGTISVMEEVAPLAGNVDRNL